MNGHNGDAHDHGFSHDLPRLIGRRRLLSLMGGLGLASAAGLPAAALDCVALPWETAGPFPADGTNTRAGQTVNALTQEGVIRRDIRASFGDYAGAAAGVDLELELTLQDADGCAPLENYAVYIWHCDAIGQYSLYNAPEANYLRGVGVADADGKIQFTTIVPGCYPGRWPHIHFEVFESAEAALTGRAPVLTSQIAFAERDMAEVYRSDGAYSNGTQNLERISLVTDGIFRDNTDAQIAQQTVEMSGAPENGYTGQVTIPIDLNARR